MLHNHQKDLDIAQIPGWRVVHQEHWAPVSVIILNNISFLQTGLVGLITQKKNKDNSI